jgi:DNA-binding ferritin-like protein (Dps family)
VKEWKGAKRRKEKLNKESQHQRKDIKKKIWKNNGRKQCREKRVKRWTNTL